jgi:hypothetical protein
MSKALRSGRLEKKRRIRAAVLSGVIVTAGGLLAYGSYRAVNSAWAQVTLTDVVGAEVLSRDELMSAAASALGEPRALIPRSSSFFFDGDHAEVSVSQDFPRIMKAEMRRTGWGTAVLSVTERAPAAYACTRTTCVSLDNTGIAFAHAPSFALSDLPVLEAVDLLEVGAQFLSAEALRFVTEAWDGMQVLAMKPVRAAFDGDDLRIEVPQGAVLISSRIPLPDSLEVLRAAVRQEPSAQVIDVRFPGKVIYREATAPEPAPAE